jgi:prophage antirepressor-like protein
MSISSLITNIYDNILKFNNINIIILFDESNNIWLSYNNVLNSINYKDPKTQKKRFNLDNKYFDTYENLYKKSKLNKIYTNIQPATKMINESGLYILLSKSSKKIAKDLMENLFIDILPSLRKTGKFNLNTNEKQNMLKLTKKLEFIQKEQSMKRLTSKKYTDYKNTSGKGFIYVLKVKTLKDGKEKHCFKIGYTTNLNKRLEIYKTGHPDIELVHKENVNVSKKQLEKCVLNLNIMKRISSKHEIICDSTLDEIKNEIQDCKKLIIKYSNQSNIKTKKNIKIKV